MLNADDKIIFLQLLYIMC